MTDERSAESELLDLPGELERNETARRGRLRRVMMMVGAVAVGLLLVVWFWVTQPLFSVKAGSEKVSFDAKRLETHVRMLAETFSPRDHAHPDNLNKVADYIRNELGAATLSSKSGRRLFRFRLLGRKG